VFRSAAKSAVARVALSNPWVLVPVMIAGFVALIVAAALGVAIGTALLQAQSAAACGRQPAGAIAASGPGQVPGVPQGLLAIYEQAAAEYALEPDGWAYLAAINYFETDFGQNLSTSSAGAIGWMQFMPSSWAQYGVDANGDGTADPYDKWDAIFAAARLLRASGAPGSWSQAIFAYNHAGWYVAEVTARARQYLGAAPSSTTQLVASTPVPAAANTAGLTVKGQPATPTQLALGGTLLAVAQRDHANAIAATAMIYAAIWESSMTAGGARNRLGYGGVLAGGPAYATSDTVGQANGFLDGGPGYGNGQGAITRSQTTSNPVQIAVQTEIPSIWPDNAYSRESGYPGDQAAAAEAAKWVTHASGLPGGVAVASTPSCSTSLPTTILGGFTNPFPDGWTPTRLDAGYDGTFKNRIVAPFAATVTYKTDIGGGAGNWGGWITIRADGNIGQPSRVMYFAEGIHPNPALTVGSHVNAGDLLATPVQSPWVPGPGGVGNIEFGLAQDGPNGQYLDVLAKAVADPRNMVLQFASWCERVLHLPPPATTDHAGYE
jgi:hypothetical protein